MKRDDQPLFSRCHPDCQSARAVNPPCTAYSWEKCSRNSDYYKRSLKNCDWTLVYWAWWEMSWSKTPARVDRVKETSSRLNWSLVLAVFDQQFPCKLLRRKPPTLWLHGKPILSLGPAAEEVSFSKQVVPGQNVPFALFAQSIFNLTAFPIYPSISRALSDG